MANSSTNPFQIVNKWDGKKPWGFWDKSKVTAKFRDKWFDDSLGVIQPDVAVCGEPGKLGRGNMKVTCNTLFLHMLEIFHNKKL